MLKNVLNVGPHVGVFSSFDVRAKPKQKVRMWAPTLLLLDLQSVIQALFLSKLVYRVALGKKG